MALFFLISSQNSNLFTLLQGRCLNASAKWNAVPSQLPPTESCTKVDGYRIQNIYLRPLVPHHVYFETFESFTKKKKEFGFGGLENTGVQRLQPSRCNTHWSDFQMFHLLNKTCLSLNNGATQPGKKKKNIHVCE